MARSASHCLCKVASKSDPRLEAFRHPRVLWTGFYQKNRKSMGMHDWSEVSGRHQTGERELKTNVRVTNVASLRHIQELSRLRLSLSIYQEPHYRRRQKSRFREWKISSSRLLY